MPLLVTRAILSTGALMISVRTTSSVATYPASLMSGCTVGPRTMKSIDTSEYTTDMDSTDIGVK